MQSYAIDLSHHQTSATLPWQKFAGNVRAVIARACYGGGLRDRQAAEHIRRARDIGAAVGLYMFYRPSQSVQSHFDLFRSVCDQVKLAPGDIVPTIDIERDPLPAPGIDVSPAWNGPLLELVERMDECFGAKSMPYITQREWVMLGKPAWVLDPERPLWVANYTSAPAPATPAGRDWTIWQHRVGPFVPNGPGGYDKAHPELDQDRIAGDLPLLGAVPLAATDQVATVDDAHDDELESMIERHVLLYLDEIAHAPRGADFRT